MADQYSSEGGEGGEGGEAGQRRGLADPKDIRAIAQQLVEWSQDDNLAFVVPEGRIHLLGQRCVEGYEIDVKSREEWLKGAERYMDLALQRAQPKSSPWPNCSNVIWPLLSQATNEFAETVYPAVVNGKNVVKTKIIGDDKGTPAMGPDGQAIVNPQTGEPQFAPGQEPNAKRKRADKVSEHMSYQLLSQQTEWQEDTDRMLRAIPTVGCAARKSWFDPVWGRNNSMFVNMMDLVVNFYAKSLQRAPRITEVFELYPHEIEEKVRSEEFIDFAPGQSVPQTEQDYQGGTYYGDPKAPHIFLEQHCFWDLDGDGYEEPYIVTIHKASFKVVAIKARYTAEGIRLTRNQKRIARIEPLHYYTLYTFIPNPESAIYGLGYGHMLGPINEALNSVVNQMFDAGTLSITQGGFVGTGLSMHTGALRFKMGEFKPVNAPGKSLSDAFWQPNFPGPNAVMFQLFGALMDAGRQLGGINALTTGQAPAASTDPMTMMAMMEQGLKVFKGVYKRILRSMGQEFTKLFDLNRRFMPKQGLKYKMADEQFEITADDYAVTSGVESVGDPELITDMQRLMRAQVLGAFKDDPLCNGKEIRRRILQASNIEEVDNIVLDQPPPNPILELEVQLKQAELANALVQQQKDRAQSILFLMQARKAAAEADAKVIDAQLEREWIRIEQTNTQISAIGKSIEAHKVKVAEKAADAKAHADRAKQRAA